MLARSPADGQGRTPAETVSGPRRPPPPARVAVKPISSQSRQPFTKAALACSLAWMAYAEREEAGALPIVAASERAEHRQQGSRVGYGVKELGVGCFDGGEGLHGQVGAAAGDAQLLGPGVGSVNVAADQALGFQLPQHL